MLAASAMIDETALSGTLALDTRNLSELRRYANQNSPEALKATARQFEAVFINMILKSMRDATPSDGPMDSEQSRLYVSILDQQLSQSMASKGVGLADVLVRQLTKFVGSQSPEIPAARERPAAVVPLPSGEPGKAEPPLPAAQAFRARVALHAEAASRATGIPAEFMIGHAALESGWGRREIVGANGANSYNLFGIKATSAWKGRVVESVTSEFVDGAMQKTVGRFRAYDSYEEAFKDYATLLSRNPRYRDVISSAHDLNGFAQSLQRAGYATDPSYGDKLARVIKRVITS
jgi:flagellar protein FlgJ